MHIEDKNTLQSQIMNIIKIEKNLLLILQTYTFKEKNQVHISKENYRGHD